MDERAFIAQFEAASPAQLAVLLQETSPEQERALRAYLGEDRHNRMRAAAARVEVRRGVEGDVRKGNVVVLPGIMGSELAAIHGGVQTPVWLSYFHLMTGWLARLRLNDDGDPFDPSYEVRATGVLNKYYGELLLHLAANWNVRAFWYDWRKDLADSAAELEAFIQRQFRDQPVHVVAHSMGGLVVRTLLRNRQRSADDEAYKRLGGRFIMLGTPNYGSFEIPQALTGIQQSVRLLVKLMAASELTLQLPRVRDELLTILNSFPGTYQMLPDIAASLGTEQLADLYRAASYRHSSENSPAPVSQKLLDAARRRHVRLSTMIDPSTMIYVAGYGQPTLTGIANPTRLDDAGSYLVTREGDGRVAHRLGVLSGVPTFYVEESHGDLPRNAAVLADIDGLLERGQATQLRTSLPSLQRGAADNAAARAERERHEAEIDQVFAESIERLRSRDIRARAWQRAGRQTGDDCARRGPDGSPLGANPITSISPDEQRVETLLAGGFLGGGAAAAQAAAGPFPSARPAISVRLVQSGIEDAGVNDGGVPPIDAVAVGHYNDVKPQFAEWALDQAISRALKSARQQGDSSSETRLSDDELILTQYTQRGLLRGQLGQPFLLPDPRPASPLAGARPRMIALANMGIPGRFGKPELIVLARELCWSLGRIRCKHLATVLIGAGEGNLHIADAVDAWLQGVRQALANELQPEERLSHVTFFEYNPAIVRSFDSALQEAVERFQDTLSIDYRAFSEAELDDFDEEGRKFALKKLRERQQKERSAHKHGAGSDSGGGLVPTRVTVTRKDDAWSFGAITEYASIPERLISIDPALVDQVGQTLAGTESVVAQLQYGAVLENLLIPKDLRTHFYGAAPLVFILDAATARVHWEMMVQPDLEFQRGAMRAKTDEFPADAFVGTARGFTRQLRTLFSQPPEPPPPPDRIVRVLVVADPSSENPLPGARREGTEIADLFESFNRVYDLSAPGASRVEVTRLIGPLEATRLRVLSEVINVQYDVLHYAGHCYFNDERPEKSGWIFSGGEILSANELTRLDHIPRFVFSNACESGITPDRSEDRSAALAPSFAESFFKQGVSNFVCTAWPIDDAAARDFALSVYAALLGLRSSASGTDRAWSAAPQGPAAMFESMQRARQSIAKSRGGRKTWGAYQHYGSPYFRLFTSEQAVPLAEPPAANLAVPAQALRETVAAPPPESRAEKFQQVQRAIEQFGARLRSYPNVLSVRPGYRFKEGWITDERVVVVSVLRKLPETELGGDEVLPKSLTVTLPGGGTSTVGVDVAPASPAEQLQATGAGVRGDSQPPGAAWQENFALPGAAAAQLDPLRKATAPYAPPPRVQLDEVTDTMSVLCHSSPDDSWSVLNDFLGATRKQLTVGMYDFTAPHILAGLKQAVAKAPRKLMLVLDPSIALSNGGGKDNPKADDLQETAVREALAEGIKDRFQFAWAAVKRAGQTTGGLFDSAYHIKVAVRDKKAFWLSSGNWQSTNQPAEDVGLTPTLRTLRLYNREWHIVVENPALAELFDIYLQWDFRQAAPFQEEGERRALQPQFELLAPIEPEDRAVKKTFASKRFENRPVRIQPVLTPDNYVEKIEPLIRSAQSKLYLQNQYIHIPQRISDQAKYGKFMRIVDALRDRIAAGCDVKIILRDLGDTRKMIETLVDHEIPASVLKLQKACHNKGIIVDSQTVALGSHNLSVDGTTGNRDATLIIYDADIAAYYEEIFLYDWENLARPFSSGERAMPQLVPPGGSAARGPAPEGMIRLPWDAYYED